MKTRKPGDIGPWPNSSHSQSICSGHRKRRTIVATDAEAAEQEARQYLEQHRIVEVWSTYHRRVARIVRKQD